MYFKSIGAAKSYRDTLWSVTGRYYPLRYVKGRGWTVSKSKPAVQAELSFPPEKGQTLSLDKQ